MITDDMSLVAEYARSKSEQAFETLVSRHVNIVYSVALRQTGHPQDAQEITQAVFIILARKAGSLSSNTILSGWLCRTARNAAANVITQRRRRQQREQEAYMQSLSPETDTDQWLQIAPLLDPALASLGQHDHDAVVLRFFERRSMAEIGAALGTSEEAAKKRVGRALEKLRTFFCKRNVALSAAALTAVISAHAVIPTPSALIPLIATGTLVGNAVSDAAATAVTKAFAMTVLQKAAVSLALAAVMGIAFYEFRQASLWRGRGQRSEEEKVSLSTLSDRLTRERDAVSKQFTLSQQENERLRDNTAELLKLRNEVTRLRGELAAGKLNPGDPKETAIREWIAKVNHLADWIQKHPEQQIPEFRFLSDVDWLDLVKDIGLDEDEELREATLYVRERAKENFGQMMAQSLEKYLKANNDDLPASLNQLIPYFDCGCVDETVLNRWQLVQSGKYKPEKVAPVLVTELAPVDNDRIRVEITRVGVGHSNWKKASQR